MKKGLLLFLALSIFMLTGCAELEKELGINKEETTQKEEEPKKEKPAPIPEKEITLNTGQRVEIGWVDFIFSGFTNEDTFVFERDSEWVNTTYHKASIGYQFILPRADNIYFEVTEFDRDKGTIKLKVKTVQK